MVKHTKKYNLEKINKYLSYEGYTPEQKELIKQYAKYLNKYNFALDGQRIKLRSLYKMFQEYKGKDYFEYIDTVKAKERKKALNSFIHWINLNKGEDYKTLEKEVKKRKIKSILNYEGYTKEQKEILNKYYSNLERKGDKEQTIIGRLQSLKLLFRDLNKDISQVKLKDIDKYLKFIKKYKENTIAERKIFLIVFFEWYYKKKKEDIPLIAGIKVKSSNTIKLPEEILTPDEIKEMIQVADSLRDKAIISLLYETGARRGEFLQFKIKHIDLVNKEYCMTHIPEGKTKARLIPIIYSVPHLQNWLNSHPDRNNPNAPLFCCLGKYRGKPISYDTLKWIVKTMAKRVETKKKVYPHAFRHARLTQLGKELTEQELKKFAGWTASSNMASVYVHLSGQDVSNKLLANAGLIDKKESNKEKDSLTPIKCPRCESLNPSGVKYCRCGFVLDITEVNNLLEKKHQGERIISDFFENPQAMKLLKKFMEFQKLQEIKN